MPNGDEQSSCLHCSLPVPRSRQTGDGGDGFCCFGCRFVYNLNVAGDGAAGNATGTFFLRVGLGIFLTMNLMVFNWFFYSKHIYESGQVADGSNAGDWLSHLFAYLMLALCTLVLVLVGTPIVIDVIDRLKLSRGRSFDTNLLIVVGVGAAYVISVVHAVQGRGALYFDTAALIIVLVTLGGYLDARAKQNAMESGDALLSELPSRVNVRRNGSIHTVSVDDVVTGDHVQTRPGERVVVDGTVLEGTSDVNESVLTGESKPRTVAIGDSLLAGSIAMDGQLWIKADRVGKDRVINQVREMLEKARLQQPTIQRLADRVAGVFIPLVFVLTACVFVFTLLHAGFETALLRSLSVLLISCPCALGLAAPLATFSAITRAAGQGILFDAAPILERAAAVKHIVFDKTGTLTDPQLAIEAIEPRGDWTVEQVLAIAASVESGSDHPVARSLCDEAAKRAVDVGIASNVIVLPGRGVEGVVNGHEIRVGNASLLESVGLVDDAVVDDAHLRIYLIERSSIIASFSLAESIKRESHVMTEQLRTAGYSMQVLTGDEAGPANRLATALGVLVTSRMLPGRKLSRIDAMKNDNSLRGRVAFVGDGINDAPALASADVGVVVQGATDLASGAGNVHLIGRDVDALPEVFAIARDAVRRIKLNLFWAFGYNTVGLTLATFGLLNPVFAAMLMVTSSSLIVMTSRQAGAVDQADVTIDNNSSSQASVKLIDPESPAAVATASA